MIDRTIEKQALQKLTQTCMPQHAIDIYNEFIHNYRNKHIGQMINDDMDPNAWYQKRGEIFSRYIQRYYLRDKK